MNRDFDMITLILKLDLLNAKIYHNANMKGTVQDNQRDRQTHRQNRNCNY